MEYFLTCIVCGYQEILDEEDFDKKRKDWLFIEEGKVCSRCSSFPEAIKEAIEYRKNIGTHLDSEGKSLKN